MSSSEATFKSKKSLLTNLKRVEGQVRGIGRMIEEDRYCSDILIQLAAVKAGINKIGMSIIESHTRGCLSSAFEEKSASDNVDELVEIISKFVK